MTNSVFSKTSQSASRVTASHSRQRQPPRGHRTASSPQKANPCSTCVKEYGSKRCCEVSAPHASPTHGSRRPQAQSHRRPSRRSTTAVAARTAATASHGDALLDQSPRTPRGEALLNVSHSVLKKSAHASHGARA